MAKKAKASGRRKGARAIAARALALTRSRAAKKGWVTRRANKRKTGERKRSSKKERVVGSKETAKRPKKVSTRAKTTRATREKTGQRKTTQRRQAAKYANLAAFVKAYEEWDGDFDYFEIETNADY